MMKTYIFILLFFFVSCSSDKPIGKEITNEDLGFFKDDLTFEFFMVEPEKNVFKLWIPDGVIPKAILVLAPGGAGDGTNLVKLDHWKEYAKKENLALLGVYVKSDSEGAASRLLNAIEIISKHNNLNELQDLPFLLRGFSHGGGFSYAFSKFYKNKVIAYANIKGNVVDVNEKLPPGLFIIGENDNEIRNEYIKKSFLSQREKNAVVCFATEPRVGHDIGNSDDLVKSFFSEVLDKRTRGKELIEVDEDQLFLGNNSTFTIYSYSDYPYKKTEASCIVSYNFGDSWKSFMN